MNPKKPKEFIKPTADTLDTSEVLVQDVVEFYWAAVRKALSDLESPSVAVSNLGTFKVRYNKIELLKKRHQSYLDNIDKESMTFNKHNMSNVSKAKLESLDNIKKQLQDEHARKQEVKLKRTEYVTNKALEE